MILPLCEIGFAERYLVAVSFGKKSLAIFESYGTITYACGWDVDSALGMQNGLTYADLADRGKTAEKMTEKTRQQRDMVSSQGRSNAVKGFQLFTSFCYLLSGGSG